MAVYSSLFLGNPVALPAQQTRRQWGATGRIVLACAILAVPLLLDLARSPTRRPFAYAAADTFYYLSVARNIVEHASISMDGVHPTNGFHPLWQAAVALIYAACKLLHVSAHCVLATVLASLLCMVGGVYRLGRALQHGTGNVPAAFVGLPFGVYALAALVHWGSGRPHPNGFEGPLPLFGTLYALVNGMESGVTILAFATVAWVFVTRSRESSGWSGAKCGGALAFLCFARLDHGAFALFPLLAWATESLNRLERRRFAVSATVAFALPVLLYLAINEAYCGVALPISGAKKSSFPVPQAETLAQLTLLVKNPFGVQEVWRVTRLGPPLLAVALSLIFCAVLLRHRIGRHAVSLELRRGVGRFDAFLLQMTPGALLIAIYNITFVEYSAIGHWYHPVLIVYCSLVVIRLMSLLSEVFTAQVGPRAVSVGRGLVTMAIGILTLAGFRHYLPANEYMRRYAQLYWDTGPRVRNLLAGRAAKILEYDDGVVGYSLGTPALSGLALSLDPEGVNAWRAGHLVDVAVGRGFNALATHYYMDHKLTTGTSSATALAWAHDMTREDLSEYEVTVAYNDDLLTIVELSKKAQ